MNFDTIIEKIENNTEILNYKFTNTQIPMYLPIRFILLQSFINKEFNLSNPYIKANCQSIIKISHYIYHTLKSNLFFAPRKNIYIFSSDILNIENQGKFRNRLHDPLCNVYADQTQLFEISSNLQYKTPKNRKVFFLDLVFIISKIFSIFARQTSKDLKTISLLLDYLNQKITLDQKQYSHLRHTLIRHSKSIDIQYFLYKLFLRIKKPKLLIIDCAHYGIYSPLILVAKERGIITVEYQHGYVGLAHPAYNFHKNIFAQIKNYLPDYFLTHGKYWSERVRTPSEKIEIGLTELENKTKTIYPQKRKRILFISGGTVYKELNSLIESSYNSLQSLGYEIFLRPHPSEITDINVRYGNLIAQGLLIDNLLLYDSLSITEIVVGMEISTVLFEAVYFTKKIYLKDTDYTRFYEPKSEFILFQNDAELYSIVNNGREIIGNNGYWWSQNSLQKYKLFIEMITNPKHKGI